MSDEDLLNRLRDVVMLHSNASASAVTGEWKYYCTGCLIELQSPDWEDELDEHQIDMMRKIL